MGSLCTGCIDRCILVGLKGTPDECLCKYCCCRVCYTAYHEGREELGYSPKNFWKPPDEGGASLEAQELTLACLKDLDPAEILDCHVHILASGPEEKNGCYLHDNWYDVCCHPMSGIKRMGLMLFLGKDTLGEDIDEKYTERLTEFYHYFLPPKMRPEGGPRASLLAMDEWHDEKGIAHPEMTAMHIDNSWVDHIINEGPESEIRKKHFHLTPSIHPYKLNACEELKYWHSKGARQVKWLPNTQGIDPMSHLCDNFYKTMAELKPPMWLLTHTGNEHTLNDAGVGQNRLGNPLRLRRPLELGVNVIAAHVSGVGYYQDLDAPNEGKGKRKVQAVKLLFRLFEEVRQGNLKGQLYADVAAFTSWSRVGLAHKSLANKSIHPYLLYGSDFPVIAINLIVWLCCLNYFHDLLPPKVSHLVREIYYYNPCLSDFVKKRCMRYRDPDTGEVYRLPNEVFQRGGLIYKDIIAEQKAGRKSATNTPDENNIELVTAENKKND